MEKLKFPLCSILPAACDLCHHINNNILWGTFWLTERGSAQTLLIAGIAFLTLLMKKAGSLRQVAPTVSKS